MKTVAVVPAKGESARIPNKNLSILDGEFLFRRKLRQLLECADIDEVWLDTESDQVAGLVADLPVHVLRRPADLASNRTDGHELFAFETAHIEADVYVQCLCTAPFVTGATVSRALKALAATPSADSLVGVSCGKQYTWQDGSPVYGWGRIPNSVDLPAITIEAMSLYAVKRMGPGPILRRFGRTPILFELDPEECVDVNWPNELILAETIATGQRARENLELDALKPHLSSAILADVTRELGMCCVLPREISGSAQRVFGRAKTIELDAVKPGEDWKRIYEALRSYDFVRQGDVILVKNSVPGCAYFGNLNAHLAVRAGAVGAVIDGLTRDAVAVAQLDFPVFSRGHYCVDIKFQGVLRSIGSPIRIGDVRIEAGDYVFGDSDGVVVIPKVAWPRIREEVLKGIEREWQVSKAVALGHKAPDIYTALGEF